MNNIEIVTITFERFSRLQEMIEGQQQEIIALTENVICNETRIESLITEIATLNETIKDAQIEIAKKSLYYDELMVGCNDYKKDYVIKDVAKYGLPIEEEYQEEFITRLIEIKESEKVNENE